MNTTTATTAATIAAREHLRVVPPGRRSAGTDRDVSLHHVRRALVQLRGHDGRFAHLKRMYD
jgi:hypothetical protein